LDHELSHLKAASDDIDVALADDSAVPLRQVVVKLEHLVVTYQRAADWVRKLGKDDVPLTNEPYGSGILSWRAINKVFLDALGDLGLRSDFPEAKFILANGDVRKFMGLDELTAFP